MKIKQTKNYDLFKTIEGNRGVITQHIKKLVNTLSNDDLTGYMPIVVNEKMEVIDGQHRLEALKQLNLPVNYIVIAGTDLATVQMLNSSAKSWSLNDYVDSYIKCGNSNYKILSEFKNRWNLPLSISVSLLMTDGQAGRSNGLGNLIKNGEFVVKSLRYADATATYISEFRKHIDKRLLLDRDLLIAFTKVVKTENVNLKKFIHKLRLLGSSLKRQSTINEYLRELERIYNFKNRGGDIRFF